MKFTLAFFLITSFFTSYKVSCKILGLEHSYEKIENNYYSDYRASSFEKTFIVEKQMKKICNSTFKHAEGSILPYFESKERKDLQNYKYNLPMHPIDLHRNIINPKVSIKRSFARQVANLARKEHKKK